MSILNISFTYLFAIAFSLCLFLPCYAKDNNQPNDPDHTFYPYRGLDVSHYQGVIYWPLVPTNTYKFVYIKATEGGDFIDKMFKFNWKGARQTGIKVGAYHVWNLCKNGPVQAKNFMSVVDKEKDSLPPVIDLEYSGSCKIKERPDRKEFYAELEKFFILLEKHYQQLPVIYTNYLFYRDYLRGSKYALYPIWIRDVENSPDPLQVPYWVMWQYTDKQNDVSGIKGNVDVNAVKKDTLFYRTYFEKR